MESILFRSAAASSIPSERLWHASLFCGKCDHRRAKKWASLADDIVYDVLLIKFNLDGFCAPDRWYQGVRDKIDPVGPSNLQHYMYIRLQLLVSHWGLENYQISHGWLYTTLHIVKLVKLSYLLSIYWYAKLYHKLYGTLCINIYAKISLCQPAGIHTGSGWGFGWNLARIRGSSRSGALSDTVVPAPTPPFFYWEKLSNSF